MLLQPVYRLRMVSAWIQQVKSRTILERINNNVYAVTLYIDDHQGCAVDNETTHYLIAEHAGQE